MAKVHLKLKKMNNWRGV